jgi:hypothetical protein
VGYVTFCSLISLSLSLSLSILSSYHLITTILLHFISFLTEGGNFHDGRRFKIFFLALTHLFHSFWFFSVWEGGRQGHELPMMAHVIPTNDLSCVA